MSVEEIITCQLPDSDDSQLAQSEMESLFQVSLQSNLYLNVTNDAQAKIKYLDYAVLRNPKDLRCHIQRISSHQANAHFEGLYGAMIDLFIVLGSNGSAIKERMLKHAGSLLNDDQRKTLRGYSESSEAARAEFNWLPLCQASLFSNGLIGNRQLVEVGDCLESNVRCKDPLEEARECIEYSQVEQARRILEKAVLHNPSQADLSIELLDIYKSTQNVHGLRDLIEQFRKAGHKVPEVWLDFSDSYTDI